MKTIMYVCSDLNSLTGRNDHFSNIKEALLSAQAKQSDEIELCLKNGHYDGDFRVDKPLSIIGVKGKQDEVILNVSILNTNGNNLTISDITIDKPKKNAILQVGGTLSMKNVIIKGVTHEKVNLLRMTKDLISHLFSFRWLRQKKHYSIKEVIFGRNACISLSGGAHLIAVNLSLFKNNLTAIRVHGENTKAVLSRVIIRDNTISPFFIKDPPLLCGAIDISNKGKLYIENSIIENNEYIGVCVYDNGNMHLRGTTITGTKQVQDKAGNSLVGHNITIASEAIVELRSFVSSHAQGCGIYVDGGYLTAERGGVNNNNIGIALVSNPANNPSYNSYNCIFDDVKFVNNVTKISSLLVALPNIDGESDASLCRRVPWD